LNAYFIHNLKIFSDFRYSICEPIELKSDVAVHLSLKNDECEGDIEIPDEVVNFVEEATTLKPKLTIAPIHNETRSNQITSNESDENIELNTNEYFKRNSSRNSKKHKRKSEQERSFVHEDDVSMEDDDQLVAAAMGFAVKSKDNTIRGNDGSNGGGVISAGQTMSVTEDKSDTVTVQLFPYRLADIFEKAERYARQTIIPLLSEQFPKIFTSNLSERRKDSIDYDESNIQFFGDLSPIQKTKKKITLSNTESKNEDGVTIAEKGRSNLESENQANVIDKIFSDMDRQQKLEKSNEKQKVYIDLPTFRY
jgi:hypothetical protein